MICRILQRQNDGIALYTHRVNSQMGNHLKAHALYRGKGVWIYTSPEATLLFAVGHYLGLGKKSRIKRQLKALTP